MFRNPKLLAPIGYFLLEDCQLSSRWFNQEWDTRITVRCSINHFKLQVGFLSILKYHRADGGSSLSSFYLW
jgi:hypothetical protein